jgi:alkylation response protein AidB-like acyl-CoA dehydrogenase
MGESDNLAGLVAFVTRRVAPSAAGWDRAGVLPAEIFSELGRFGWLGSFIPASEGGPGLGMVDYGRLHEALGRGCSSLRCALTAHDMVAFALWRWGDPETKRRWVPRMLSGEAVGAFALSERHAGSDVASIRTGLRRAGDDWILSGAKRWVSNGERADIFLVFAGMSEGGVALLVPRDVAGMTIRPMGALLGVRAAGVCEVTFEGCRLGPDAMIGGPGAGLRFVLPAALAVGRYAIASGCVGMARQCLDSAIAHATGRRQSGEPLASHQLVCRMLGRAEAGVRAAGLVCRACGELLDKGDPLAISEAALAKYFACGVAREIASDAVQIFGGEGCLEGNAVERFFRDSKVMEIIEGTNEVLELVLARHGMRQRAGRGGIHGAG